MDSGLGTTPNTESGATLDRDWLTVAASSVCLIFSVGTITLYSFGIFVRPLAASFHWSRGQLSTAVAIGQFSFAAASLLWGRCIDRFGPRKTILPAIVGLSIGVGSLMFLGPHLWQLYSVFAAIPFLAGAASPLGYAAVLIRRFDRRLGLSLGLALMGVGLGATVLPLLAQASVEHFGWRHAYGILGGLTFVVTFPAALVATRNIRFEAFRSPEGDAKTSPVQTNRSALSLMCIIFVLIGTASVGTLAHLVPMMIDHGFSPALAARVAALTGFTTIVSRGGIGTLMDKFFAPYVLAGVSLIGAAGCCLFASSTGITSCFVAALMLGVLVGAEVDFIAFFVRQYVQAPAFGRMYGFLFALFIVGSGTGPLLLGKAFDRSHTYRPGLLMYALTAVAAAGLAMLMPRYGVHRRTSAIASHERTGS
jgi:MFS family permease